MPTDRDLALQDKFLGALLERRGVTKEALEDCNISRQTFYRWLRDDEAFKTRYDQYRIALAEEVESEAVSRVLNPAGNKGSDALVTTLLKGLKKDRYADKESAPNVAIVYVSGLRDNPRVGVMLPAGNDPPALPQGGPDSADDHDA